MLIINKGYSFLIETKDKYLINSLISMDSVTIDLDLPVEIGDTYISGDLSISSQVSFIGKKIQANNINVIGNAEFASEVHCGDMNIRGNAIFSKGIQCLELKVEKKLASQGKVVCKGHIEIGSDVMVKTDFVVCGKLKVLGSLWVGRNLDAKSGLDVGGTMKVYGGETQTYGRVSMGDMTLVATDQYIYGYNFKGRMKAPSLIEEFVNEENARFFTLGNKGTLRSVASVAMVARTNVSKKIV